MTTAPQTNDKSQPVGLPGLSDSELALQRRLFESVLTIPQKYRAWLIKILEANPPRIGVDSIDGYVAPTAPGTSVDDVADLPASPNPGQIVKATAADKSSLLLAWDADEEQWVTEEAVAAVQATTPGTSSALTVHTRGAAFAWQTWDTVGLDLEVRVLAHGNSGATSTQGFYALASTADLAAALVDDTTNLSGTVTTTSTTAVTLDSGWVAVNASITVTDLIALNLASQRTAGSNNGQVRANSTVSYRWTYTP